MILLTTVQKETLTVLFFERNENSNIESNENSLDTYRYSTNESFSKHIK